MELVWKHLLHVIQEISGNCEGLISLAQRLREAVVHKKVQTVGELVIEQEKELKVFQSLEREREELMKTLQRDLNLSGGDIDAAQLLSVVPAQWSNDYRFHIEQLRQRMTTVKNENEINRKLLNQSQQFIAWLVNYLVTPENAGPVYNAAGSSQQKSFYHFINQNM
jgi:hypothetical protein